MTQQWGAPGPQSGWNRPADPWGSPPFRHPPRHPQAYGAPGFPPPPPRENPLRLVALGLALVLALGFFSFALVRYLNPLAPVPSPAPSTPTPTPTPEAPTVPDPDPDPPAPPRAISWLEVTAALEANPIYDQTIPAPTNCALDRVNPVTASVAELEDYLNNLTACLWLVWNPPMEAAGFYIHRPVVAVYTEPITTACGTFEDLRNAFYCTLDQRIYYGQAVYQLFTPEVQQIPFMVDMIMAHEFGHTIQGRTGIFGAMGSRASATPEEDRIWLIRRSELQADCFSGHFINAVADASEMAPEERLRIREVPHGLGGEGSDHGTGEHRYQWFIVGQENTAISACNTWTVPDDQVE